MKLRSSKIKNHRRSKHFRRHSKLSRRSRRSRRSRHSRQGGVRGADLGLSMNLDQANREAAEKIRDISRTPTQKYTDLDPSNPGDALLLKINKDLAEIDRIATSGSYPDILSGPTNIEESQSERKRRLDVLAEAQQAFLRSHEGGRHKKTRKMRKMRKIRKLRRYA